MTTSRVARLLTQNEEWAACVTAERPDFFEGLAAQQHPELLWIGCADSRVSPTKSPRWSWVRCSCTATSPTWCIPRTTTS